MVIQKGRERVAESPRQGWPLQAFADFRPVRLSYFNPDVGGVEKDGRTRGRGGHGSARQVSPPSALTLLAESLREVRDVVGRSWPSLTWVGKGTKFPQRPCYDTIE